jgi:type VI secretion system secreted protein Hcp
MEQTATATGDAYFLKLDGIPGESLDAQHAGEIAVESWSWGASNPPAGGGAGGGGGAGKVQMHALVFTAPISSATPKLLQACASGQHVRSAVLSARRPGAGQHEFFVITLSDVLVTSYDVATREDGPGVIDRGSLQFGKVEIEYRPQAPDGSAGTPVKAGWDVAGNRPI